MKDAAAHPPAPALASNHRRSYVKRVALISTMAGFVATALILTFTRDVTPGVIWKSLVHSMVYAHCIGTLCGAALPWLGKKLHGRPLAVEVGAVAVVVVILTVIGCSIATGLLMFFGAEVGSQLFGGFGTVLRFSIVVSLIAGVGAFLYHTMRYQIETTTLELRTRQLAEERARKLAAEARLSSLESRIHPHFLFNTLNSIASLTQEDPRKAEDTVGRLAALLRFSLDANQRSTVPLEQEIKVVRDYLEIEKTRLGERLRHSIEIPGELLSVHVPPLAIESLVENSVKYAVASRREGGEVRVRAQAANGVLTVEVADSGPGFSLEAAQAGHGIDNLMARLDVLYQGRARLDVARAGEFASVRLTLPVETK